MPSNNAVLETELGSLHQHGIQLIFERIPSSGATMEHVKAMAGNTREAVVRLAGAGADGLMYACMWTTLVTPPEWERDLADFARVLAALPFDTAAAALWRALRRVDTERLAVLSAYPRKVHEQMCALLHQHGYEVYAEGTLDLKRLEDIRNLHGWQLLELAEKVLVGAPEAGAPGVICVLGTDVPTLDIVTDLEQMGAVRVITSNQAMTSAALEMLNSGQETISE